MKRLLVCLSLVLLTLTSNARAEGQLVRALPDKIIVSILNAWPKYAKMKWKLRNCSGVVKTKPRAEFVLTCPKGVVTIPVDPQRASRVMPGQTFPGSEIHSILFAMIEIRRHNYDRKFEAYAAQVHLGGGRSVRFVDLNSLANDPNFEPDTGQPWVTVFLSEDGSQILGAANSL
jgi:hypothetical protein